MEPSHNRPPTEHAKINQFAIRCFRDTGDADYIAARLAMRSRLAGPFLWSAEQAIEKYLKCILMLNRQRTDDLSHHIDRSLNRINNSLPFEISLSKNEQEFFNHVAEWNGDRYLITSFVLYDIEVLKLDMLVWRLRQYCRPLNVIHYADTPSENVLIENIKRIEAGLNGDAKNGHIAGGALERILADKKHPAYNPLVWKNFYYSMIARKEISFSTGFQGVNAPLWLNPELAKEAAKWMKIPKEIIKAAQNLAEKRKQNKT